MKKVKPLGNRILLKRSEALDVKGNILLPESSQEKPKHGEVLAVGPGKVDNKGNLQEMSIQVGDKVLFSTYAGTEVPGEETYLIISEEDVLGLLA